MRIANRYNSWLLPITLFYLVSAGGTTVDMASECGQALSVPKSVPQASSRQIVAASLSTKGNIQGFLTRLHEQLGAVFKTKVPLLPNDLYFISDPELIRQVFTGTDRGPDASFIKSERNISAISTVAGPNNLFTAPFASWREQRKQLAPYFTAREMSRPDYSTKIESFIAARILNIRNQVAQAGGSASLDYKKMVHETTLDVISRFLFNYEISPDNLGTIADALQRAYEIVLVEAMNPFQAPIHSLPAITGYQRKVQTAISALDQVINDIIAQFEKNPDQGSAFMALLTRMRDPNKGPITRSEIHDQIFAFLEAGSETVAHITTWAVHEILMNAQVKQKLTVLIRTENVVGANEYIDQIWNEAVRLHMPLPFIPRQAQQEVTLSGSWGSVRFTKGSTVVLDTGVMQRREDIWGVAKTGFPANEFHPERFSPENQEMHGMKNEDLKTYAFGGGPRVCIGAMLGGLEAKTIIFQFFKAFESEVQQSNEPKVSRLNDALMSPRSLRVRVAP